MRNYFVFESEIPQISLYMGLTEKRENNKRPEGGGLHSGRRHDVILPYGWGHKWGIRGIFKVTF